MGTEDGGGMSGASPAMGRSSQVSVSVLVWLVGRDLTLHPLDTSLDISLLRKQTELMHLLTMHRLSVNPNQMKKKTIYIVKQSGIYLPSYNRNKAHCPVR